MSNLDLDAIKAYRKQVADSVYRSVAADKLPALVAEVEQVRALLEEKHEQGFKEGVDAMKSIELLRNSPIGTNPGTQQAHNMKIVDGEIRVCDTCLNSDGNAVAWEQTWHEGDRQTVTREALADVFAQFAVKTNPYGLSVGIDMSHELADAILAADIFRDEREVKAEALEELSLKFGTDQATEIRRIAAEIRESK